MRAVQICVGVLALLCVLGYVWVSSLPYHTVRRARRLASCTKDWARACWRMATKLQWERPHSTSGERKAWFIWCRNCHKRVGMAVQTGERIEVRIGPRQSQLILDEATAKQFPLLCHHCGKPAPIIPAILASTEAQP